VAFQETKVRSCAFVDSHSPSIGLSHLPTRTSTPDSLPPRRVGGLTPPRLPRHLRLTLRDCLANSIAHTACTRPDRSRRSTRASGNPASLPADSSCLVSPASPPVVPPLLPQGTGDTTSCPSSECHRTARDDRARLLPPPITPAHTGTRTHRPPSHQSVPVETPQRGATQQSGRVFVQPTHVQNARRSERAAVVSAQRAAASGERAGGERQRASDSDERAATERQRAASERQWRVRSERRRVAASGERGERACDERQRS